MKKIYAIVVTYNPELKNLNESLDRILKEVDGVIVCNNSIQNLNILKKNVECFNFGENLGIARAQSIGMKKAFQEYNADFIIQFDQDSLIDSGMIQKLIQVYNTKYSKNILAIVGPQNYDKDTLKEEHEKFFNRKKDLEDRNIIEVEVLISSGCLISKDVYYKNGSMKDEWFIDIVDFEYCWRAKKNNIKILKVKDAKLAHKVGNGKTKTKIGLKIETWSPIRHYYQFRNNLYALKLDYVPLKYKISIIIKFLFQFLFYRYLLKDGIIRKDYMKKGINDFVQKKVGQIL
ncbi:MAG: glycosyltransferase family 2 protein [Cetobacterium sp.]